MTGVEVVCGIVRIGDRPVYASSVDYPYYRADVEQWPCHLDALASLGHRFVTSYVPWRHHELERDGGRRFDFSGQTRPNRDVVGLLRLCAARNLSVILKPGPFVHAELNYGGLPDFVCPSRRTDIEAMLAADGSPVTWGGGARVDGKRALEPWPLPAPFDPVFAIEVERWLAAVRRELIAPFAAPDGPIVLIQVANEGIYSNAQHAPWAYDYSPSSLALFQQWLARRYGDLDAYRRVVGPVESWEAIEPPREWRPPTRLTDLLPYRDWSAYQASYMAELYRRLVGQLDTSLPCLVNVNPPLATPYGIDAWLSRVDPDQWPEVHYGFTDWIGVAADDPSVVDRYEVMVRRSRGPNLEENWGLSDLYETAYAADAVPFHQTLLAVALGATGHNVYPGVRTAAWEADLDRLHDRPYAPVAPITETGARSARASTAALLNAYFERFGPEFLECRSAEDVAIALYLPYAQVGAWLDGSGGEATLGLASPGRALAACLRQLRAGHVGAGLVNLEACTDGDLARYRVLIVPAGPFMAREAQQRLAAAADGGRSVVLLGSRPAVDDQLQPCALLGPDRATLVPLDAVRDGLVPLIIGLGVAPAIRSTSAALTWLWSHPDRDLAHVFVLTGSGEGGAIELQIEAPAAKRRVSLVLPGGSGAIVRIADGRVAAFLMKGRNERSGEAVAPAVEVDADRVTADRPCDLLVVVKDDVLEAYTAGEDGHRVRVTGRGRTIRAEPVLR